ncbi:hypothetical protein ACIA5D_42790 [Actinoplanes sp. NPDC051513]|uniref:hypothetical protein n=1 Tax=Actinoplanes sp. NPDC051513 TaxID=3363908 RepID=UPI003790AD02
MLLDVARRSAAAALLLLAVAACDGGSPSTPAPTAAPPVSTSAEPSAASSEAPPSAATSAPSIGSTGGTSPATTPRPAASAEGVQLVKTGGIAGVSETTEVKPDGTWRRSGSGKGTTAGSGKLTDDQMAQLQKLIADPKLATEGKRATGQGRCSDAFEYLLVVRYQLIHYTACGQAGKPEITLKIIELLQSATKGR